VLTNLTVAAKGEAYLEAQLGRLRAMLNEPELLERRGRDMVEALALLAAGTILRADAPAVIADAFISTRFGGVRRQTYGQGLEESDTRAIVERALPA
jgi:putative acyl-CoA dehydrogenase